MREIELKFQVPLAHRARLQRAVSTATATTQRLRASYFDTPDRTLARAGIALRMRQEGRRWVQTLKATGASAIDRLEHNVPVGGTGRLPPPLLIERHAHSPAGERLMRALGDDAPALQCLFSTDIQRVSRRVRARGAMVELALDVGNIVAGEQRLPVWEIEFELISGSVPALCALAGQWAARHGLWLDVRSKAERGDRLSRAVTVPPAVKAAPLSLQGISQRDVALRAMVGHATQQALANAADIAGGAYGADHVHQLRVAMRRLRSVLKDLGEPGGGGQTAWSTAVDAGWEQALAEPFARLGGTRDRDVLMARWAPRWVQAGVPALVWPAPSVTSLAEPDAMLREPPVQQLWLALLGFAHGEPAPADTHTPPDDLPDAAAAVLARQWRKLRPAASGFAELSDDDRHRLRKRLKRLRYVAEFVAPLFARKRVEVFLLALRKAQEALGDYNDAHVARDVFLGFVPEQAPACFAVGWLQAEQPGILARCDKALRRLMKTRRFWVRTG